MTALSLHSKGEEVTKLQLVLDHHLPPAQRLKPDGVFGLRTRDAVIWFQRQMHLAPDGVVGPETRRALGLAAAPVAPAPLIPQTLAQTAPWMSIAVAEFGVHRDMVSHHEKRIIEYLKTTTLSAADANTDSTPWCSAFVNWVMKKSGRTGTNDALAASWLTWSHGNSQASPTPGAVAVIRKKSASSDQFTGSGTGNHVGFCLESSSAHIQLLGGNQGNRVSKANFSLGAWDVRGATWPKL